MQKPNEMNSHTEKKRRQIWQHEKWIWIHVSMQLAAEN